MSAILVPTIYVRLFDHGYGREPLYVIDTPIGFFSHWLTPRNVAVCEVDWLKARKFKTFNEANSVRLAVSKDSVVKQLTNQGP